MACTLGRYGEPLDQCMLANGNCNQCNKGTQTVDEKRAYCTRDRCEEHNTRTRSLIMRNAAPQTRKLKGLFLSGISFDASHLASMGQPS